MNEPTLTLADLQAKIAKHAWEDPAFEAEFMANPKATFQKHMGQALPATLSIHAHYNTPTELHFVLPLRESAGSAELSDDDLDRVAGGEVIISTIIVTLSVGVSAATAISVTVTGNNNNGW